MPPPVLSHADSALDLASLRRRADHWMMGALLIGALVALALGASQPQWTLA